MAQIAILNKYRNELGRAYRKMYDNGTRRHRDELASKNLIPFRGESMSIEV